jgi:hypothetical protein
LVSFLSGIRPVIISVSTLAAETILKNRLFSVPICLAGLPAAAGEVFFIGNQRPDSYNFLL